MKEKLLWILLLSGLIISCQEEHSKYVSGSTARFEKISYYEYPLKDNDSPFQYRLTYYYDNGEPHRWMELDSLGKVITDYIYEYDNNWRQRGARYREEGAVNFSIENVTFKSDSIKITEWIDSLEIAYYKMIDDLNKEGKTFRAAFIGDKLHGYDSTFYTKEGFEKRIFFTNTKGRVFNDRTFGYDSLNQNGDWIQRRKVMKDTIREIHKREVYYDGSYASDNGKFYEGIISTGELSENVINFSRDESVLLLTRTSGWTAQSAFVAYAKNGVFTETIPIPALNTIYNGAISPDGDQIIYSVRNEDHEVIWLIGKEDNKWTNKINLTEGSNIEGGYFHWMNNQEIYFYQTINNGDIVRGELVNGKLQIMDSLSMLNTEAGTEFSPFVDKEKRFIIFSRYEEGDASNQGFFVSYNQGDINKVKWSKPAKLNMLPYGWSACIISDGRQFIYSDGNDIFSLPVADLHLQIDN